VKVYIDTCVISGHAKGDLPPRESRAFAELLSLHTDAKVALLTSPVAKDEIDRIPQAYRTPHEDTYAQLKSIPSAGYLVLDHGFGVIRLGVKQHPIFQSLARLLRDEGDAKHLYQAHREGASHFITVDGRTILSKASEIYSACGVDVLLPSALLAKYEAANGA
jgi:predicted nucleic acid-binding protein